MRMTEEDDERKCRECGEPNDDGEGWDGLCGNCADRQFAEDEDGANVTTMTEAQLLAGYKRLHDGLSDMIEGGRLREEHIPDDYRWLVEALAQLSADESRVVH